MNNPFKVGDKVTVNSKGLTDVQRRCTCDTQQGKAYALTHVGTWADDTSIVEPTAISYVDDEGIAVTIGYEAVTLAKE